MDFKITSFKFKVQQILQFTLVENMGFPDLNTQINFLQISPF